MGAAGRSKLDRKAEAAIAALLTEPTHAAAAAKAGVSESTLQRWLNQPEFNAAYAAARRQVLEYACREVAKVTGQAVEVLKRNMSCGTPAVEVRAAVAVLDAGFKAADRDLDHRIAELERRMTQGEQGGDRANQI